VDWKLLAWLGGIRTFEMLCLNKDCLGKALGTKPDVWFHGWDWAIGATASLPIDWEQTELFLKGVVAVWNNTEVLPKCARPWHQDNPLLQVGSPNFDWGDGTGNRIHLINKAAEMNYGICEPPEPNCWCCQIEECKAFQNWITSHETEDTYKVFPPE